MKQSVFILVALLLSPAVHAMGQPTLDLTTMLANVTLQPGQSNQPPTIYKCLSTEESANHPLFFKDTSNRSGSASQTQDTNSNNSTAVVYQEIAVQTEKIENPYLQCYFTPNIRAAFLSCIANESKGMRGAWYRFTLYDAAQAIVNGIREKGLQVNFVIDNDQFKKVDPNNKKFKGEFCSPLKLLIDNGGVVYAMNQPRYPANTGGFEILHEKFMIFENVNGKKLLWNGSWNATGQAALKNSENVIVLDDPEAIAKFEAEFVAIKACSRIMPSNECYSPRDTDRDANFARRMNGIPELY